MKPDAYVLSLFLLATGLLLAGATQSNAQIAPYIPDDELVKCPVVVIAKWDKSPLRNHDHVVGGMMRDEESFTHIEVLRVIKGDVKPGRHVLMVASPLQWAPDGSALSSGATSFIAGDVSNVAEPNIWLLFTGRSWDKSDHKKYLGLGYYRSIQPPALESYFKILAAPHPENNIPKLLMSPDNTVVKRAFTFVYDMKPFGPPTAPSVMPIWPFYSDLDERYKLRRGIAIGAWIDAAKGIVEGKDRGDLRPFAAAAYATLKKEEAIPYLRQLLADRDPKVRDFAAERLNYYKIEDDYKKGIVPDYRDVKNASSLTTHDQTTKVFTWQELDINDCHQSNGTLTLHANGKASFSCVVWNTSGTTDKCIWTALMLPSGVCLNGYDKNVAPKSPYYVGEWMDKGNPPPKYRWSWDFDFDKSLFRGASGILQYTSTTPGGAIPPSER